MEIFYPGDTYNTCTTLPRAFFPTLSFYRRVISVVVGDGIKAKYSPYPAECWVDASMRVLKVLETVGVKIYVTGMNVMDTVNEPCVFIANHMSTLETFLLPCLIQPRKDVTFIVKKSLIEYPIFNHVLKSRDPIIVGRSNPREDLQAVLEGGEKRLKQGRSIIVFPQSTRSDTFQAQYFNTIGIKLAKRAQVPVIPIALKTDAWKAGILFKDFGSIDPDLSVHFAFGKPFMVEGNGKEDHATVIEFIQKKLEEWNCLPQNEA